MISYKKVLPPEKWPVIEHFLSELLYAADMAKHCGVGVEDLSVANFMQEYVYVYAKNRAREQSDYQRDYKKARAKRLKEAGLCSSCGQVPRIEGATLCAQCRRNRRDYARRYKERIYKKFGEDDYEAEGTETGH